MEALAKIITVLKDFKDNRFYLLIFLLFAGFLIFTFKDVIKEITFIPETLQEVKNLKGLEITLTQLKVEHPLIVGYAFYVYQPKVEAYYKSLMITDISYVSDNDFFKSIPLNTQKYLNYRLVGKEYTLLEYVNPEERDYTQTYAADYVLVFNVYVKETIGEVIFTFNVKPTQEEIEVLLRKLRVIKYYVI